MGFQLGCLLAHEGQFARALPHLHAITVRQPDFADGWYFHALALLGLKREGEALVALREAHRLAPDAVKPMRALAEAEFKSGFPADALPLWKRLSTLYPADLHVCLRTGETLSRLGCLDEAVDHYRDALTRSPEAGDLWMALAQAEEDRGDRPAAQLAYEAAARLRPDWAFPLSGLLGLQRGQAAPDLVDATLALQASPTLPNADRALIGYELGKVHDARGEYGQAMSSWKDANAARQRMIGPPNVDRLASTVKRAIAALPGATMPSKPDAMHGERLVFVVGMPRSGTTLTEQLIAGHPLAHGCGELPDIALIARAYRSAEADTGASRDPGGLATHTSRLEAPRLRYMEDANRHAPADAARLVDKAPLNFLHLDLVAKLFPAARVIWCRRDPRDIAISIYGENFSLDETLATDLRAIGHYINLQHRLMLHWRSVLPISIMESRYEELITDVESRAAALIDFIGLKWDPACLDFHENARGVQTPSRWQVKQPVHTRSMGRWRHYAPELAPLIEVLSPETY